MTPRCPESPDIRFPFRALLEHERPIVEFLFHLARTSVDLDELRVVGTVDDDSVSSLAITPIDESRAGGITAAACHFYDLDGMPISAVLKLDQHDLPWAIFIWRTDHTSTFGWPLQAELLPGPPDDSSKPRPLTGSA